MKYCTLCGGKLDRNKRCTFCGLDNTKNDSMYTQMINRNTCENEPLTHVHEEPVQRKAPAQHKETASQMPKYTYNKTPVNPVPTYTQRTQTQETYSSKKKAKKPIGCLAFISFIPFIIAFIGIATSIISDMNMDVFDNFLGDGYYEEDYYYDEYSDVIDLLPEEGENFNTVLEPGIYEVGNHIPAGNYEILLDSGDYGEFTVIDNWNSIYLVEYLEMEGFVGRDDVRLFDGAYVTVSTGCTVSLKTGNAQPYADIYVENPLTKTVQIMGPAEAVVDYDPGVYDIAFVPKDDEYVYMNLEIYVEDLEYTYWIEYDSSNGAQIFHNVPLLEGTSIWVEEELLESSVSVFLEPANPIPEYAWNNFFYEY